MSPEQGDTPAHARTHTHTKFISYRIQGSGWWLTICVPQLNHTIFFVQLVLSIEEERTLLHACVILIFNFYLIILKSKLLKIWMQWRTLLFVVLWRDNLRFHKLNIQLKTVPTIYTYLLVSPHSKFCRLMCSLLGLGFYSGNYLLS